MILTVHGFLMRVTQNNKNVLYGRKPSLLPVCLTMRDFVMETLNEPAHEIMVLITQATSEDSGEPADPRSLTRAFAVRTHAVWKLTKGSTKNRTSSPTGWLCMRVRRMSLWRTKSTIIS